MDYVRLDAGSQWSFIVEADMRWRQGRPAEALTLLRKLPRSIARLAPVEPCLEGRSLPDGDAALREFEAQIMTDRDPEPKYFEATHMAWCGNTGLALRLLRRAVADGYLAVPGMDRDPLLAKVRSTPEFAAIRALAFEKQQQLAARRGGS